MIDSKGHLLEYPLPGDVALIAAHKADEQGSLVYRKTAPNFGPIMAVWRSIRAGSDTKTERSRRTLALPQSAVAALREQRKGQAAAKLAVGDLWRDHGLVFTSNTGKPLDDANVRSECAKAGISFRRHDLS